MNVFDEPQSRSELAFKLRAEEKLGGLPLSSLPQLGDHLTAAFAKAVGGVKADPLYREAYRGKAVAVIAITETVYHGYGMAYMSGLGHRISGEHARWKAVHGPLSGYAPNNPHESVDIPPKEALESVDFMHLGASIEGLFKPELGATYNSEPTLFVYPENWLTPKYECQIIDKIVKDDRIKHAIVITKSAVICTDCFAPFLTVIGKAHQDEA